MIPIPSGSSSNCSEGSSSLGVRPDACSSRQKSLRGFAKCAEAASEATATSVLRPPSIDREIDQLVHDRDALVLQLDVLRLGDTPLDHVYYLALPALTLAIACDVADTESVRRAIETFAEHQAPRDLGVDRSAFNRELDDAPYFLFNFFPYMSGYATPSQVLEIWKAEFDGSYRAGGCFLLVVHPFCIGRHPRIALLRHRMDAITPMDSA